MARPRRILLTPWGSYGDLFPYLALAIRLKALGHVPVLATCGFYRDLIAAAGIEFHPMAPDIDPADTALVARMIDRAHGSEVIVRDVIVPHVREAFAQVRDAARGADLIVTHPVSFAAPLVARAEGRPWLSSVLAPASMFSLTDFPILPPAVALARLLRTTRWTSAAFMALGRRVVAPWTRPIRAFAKELGLPDAGEPLYEGQYSPHGTLALFSPVIGLPQPDWPPHTTTTGFVFHEDDRVLDAPLRDFLDRGPAPVVFTLGTSAVGAPGRFWDETREALRRLACRAVLLAGPEGLRQMGPSPGGDVFVSDYAPHAPLFARAAVIVHHGGVGTTAQALRAGRPMLVVPHAHDQPDNAFRVRRLGVARVIDAQRYRAPRVAAHLEALLEGDGYRARAEAIGRRVSAERGVERACDAVIAACPRPAEA